MKKQTNIAKGTWQTLFVIEFVYLFLFFAEWLQLVLWHSWYTKTSSIFLCRPANLNRPVTDTFCCLTRLLLIYTLIFYKLKPGILCLYWKNFIRATILQQQAWHSFCKCTCILDNMTKPRGLCRFYSSPVTHACRGYMQAWAHTKIKIIYKKKDDQYFYVSFIVT